MIKSVLLKTACLFYLLFNICEIRAQTLFGTTAGGGNGGTGTIGKFEPAANTLTVAKSFESNPATPYYTSLIQANDGKLYGMTSKGGDYSTGVIFSFDPISSSYSKLKDLDSTNGCNPHGSLMQAGDGKLYGMTQSGGSKNVGVIFCYDPSSAVYTKLLDFDNVNGASPSGSLIQAGNGKLYGMAAKGGSKKVGVIFSFDPVSSNFTKLKDFDNINGRNPYGSLLQAADGKLYGMTNDGGSNANDYGVIFSFDPFSNTIKRLFNFNYTNGANPYGSLIQASNGKLYGMTYNGGSSGGAGVIFSFTISSSTYTKLKDNGDNGYFTHGSLIQAGDGKLYGMTAQGGSTNAGVIFSFDPVSSVSTTVKNFDNDKSYARPYGSLVQASNGKLYGMTTNGGSSGVGVIFSYDPVSSNYTELKDFGSNYSGISFSGKLLQARDKKLYGMTSKGGSYGYGVIFSYNPSSGNYIKLRDFDELTGANPYGSLIQGGNGKLYGMTAKGGSSDDGVIFSYDPLSFTYIKLVDFNFDHGTEPYGSLIQAFDGKLYGMTSNRDCDYEDGCGFNGAIFSYDLSVAKYTKVWDFEYGVAGHPYGDLVQANDGKLYGMTRYGGEGYGGIFSYDPLSANFKLLKHFDLEDNGLYPTGSLVQASDGKLYGMTVDGGTKFGGIIFSYDPSSTTYTKLKDLDEANGSSPYGDLMQASDGKLYGMTNEGGSRGYGVIFSYDPSSAVYTKLKDYNGPNGGHPFYGSGFIELKDSIKDIAPQVTLTSPANNATYLAGGNVYLHAIASDADGTVSKVEFYNDTTLLYTTTDTPYAFKWEHVLKGNYILIAKATDNDGMVAISDTVHISVVPNKPPTVSIINPANGQTFLKGATVHLEAAASDADGRIGKVEFYSGTTLLATEQKVPYTFDYKISKTGNYILTAKATDNWGAVTTSAAINITVVPNQPPTVSLMSPSNGQIFTAPGTGATINLEAAAQDPDGRIVQVSFYNGAALLTNSENKLPYTYQWQNVPPGAYTITAKAKDNWNAETTSAPITITVILPGTPLVSGHPVSSAIKTGIKEPATFQLAPNPAKNILNIYTKGFQRNKQTILPVITASGVTIKTKQSDSYRINNPMAIGLTPTIQLDVSSLASGVYTISLIRDDKVRHEKFVKL